MAGRRTRWASVLLLVGLPGLLGATAAGVGALGLEAASSEPPPVILPVGVAYTHATNVPVVEVQVVGGPKLKLILDTGSTGVLIYQSRLSSLAGFEPTSYDFYGASFGDGTTFFGTGYEARLKFGRHGPVTRETPVEVVSSLACRSGTDCGATELERGTGAYGVDGTLGIGTETDSIGLPNPLRMLPWPYDSYWSVSIAPAGVGGTLSLGTTPEALGWVIPMTSQGWDRWGRQWSSGFEGCWSSRSSARWCIPTLLDTGTTDLWLYGRHPLDLSVSPIGNGMSIAFADQAWSVSVGGRVLIAQGTGETYGVYTQQESPANAVVGVHALGGLTIGYDLHEGLISVVRTQPGQ